MPPFHQLALDKSGRPTAISCHCWNADNTQIAYCPNDNTVNIASFDGKTFTHLHTLKEHDQLITSIDWAAATNRIVTCSQDRNAYVWEWQAETWKPTLVLLRINRSATFVRWSPSGKKFAVASGEKKVAVCCFEEENNWWVSKLIEDSHNSTVLTLSWHPGDLMLATGSTDGKVRIFSVAIKGPDKRPPPVFGQAKPSKFGQLEAIFDCSGWVHDVLFNSSGTVLAYAGHDSTLSFVNIGEAKPTQADVSTIFCSALPYRRLLFVADDKLVAAGHDCNPTFFSRQGAGWTQGKQLDRPTAGGESKQGGVSAMFRKFEMASSRGEEATTTSSIATVHQNAISDMRAMQSSGPNVTSFATTGLDGRCVIWELPSLETAMGNLSVA